MFLEEDWAVLSPASVLRSEGQNCVVELSEGYPLQVFAVHSLHEHEHVLIAELSKLQVVAQTIGQVLNCDAAEIVAVKKVKGIFQIEIVLECQVNPEGLQVLAHENDLF